LREWIEQQEHLEAEAVRLDRLERGHANLAALLNGYVQMLELQGKLSAKSVRGSVTRHVLEAWPELAAVKASSVTRRELTQVISRLVELGKGREAAKLRSYIRAAYAAALRADGDPTIPPALRGFNLDRNPAADLAALSQFNKIRDIYLSLPELQALWRRLEVYPGTTGAALRLCLLLGGQRPAQLLRIKTTDVDLHAGTVTLYDGKGKRLQPRAHILPLTELARQELEPWLEPLAGRYVLSSTGGRVPIWAETLSDAFTPIAQDMLELGEVKEKIELRDLRTTVETQLAAAGIPMEVRAQLQSHGLGGVQNRHYDKHRYMAEKLNALKILQGLLVPTEPRNVLAFQRA
jgi:integrase